MFSPSMLNKTTRLRLCSLINTKYTYYTYYLSISNRNVVENTTDNTEILINKGGGSEATFDYIMKYGNRFVPYFQEAIDLTKQRFPGQDYLITSPDQCYFFKWLMPIIKCKKAIEIGVFTGSSSVAIALGMPNDGQLYAFDVNKEYTLIAQQIWKKAGIDHKIELHLNGGIDGLDMLINEKSNHMTFDFAYVDAVKLENKDYFERLMVLMKKDGIIAF
eukprot:477387_1